MRVILIVGWLFAGLGGVIFHYGPGREKLELDHLGQMVDAAHVSVESNEYGDAVELYDQVLADLPAEKQDSAHRLTLEKCKAQMLAKQLPQAREGLETLLEDLREDESADPKFLAEVQSTLANSQYYMTWLMRLEGLPEAEWMPEIEAARQHYTQVAVDAEELGDAELASRSSEDLESAIRLARMDLGELQGLPLPSQ